MVGEAKRGRAARGRGRAAGGSGSGRAKNRGTVTASRNRGRKRKLVIESDDEQEEQEIETSDVVDNIVQSSPEGVDEEETTVTAAAVDTAASVAPKSLADDPTVATPTPADRDAKDMESESEKRMKRMMEIEAAMTNEIDSIVRGKIHQPFMASFLTHLKQPQIMEQFQWKFKRSKIAESIPSPNIHMCDLCKHPILTYGRLMYCKHILCLSCADKCQSHCPRCNERIYEVEKAKLGTVFMCYHEGTYYGYDGCRRTYLSMRDLQAHVDHRHKPRPLGELSVAEPKENIGPSLSHTFVRPYDRPGPGPVRPEKSSVSNTVMSRDTTDEDRRLTTAGHDKAAPRRASQSQQQRSRSPEKQNRKLVAGKSSTPVSGVGRISPPKPRSTPPSITNQNPSPKSDSGTYSPRTNSPGSARPVPGSSQTRQDSSETKRSGPSGKASSQTSKVANPKPGGTEKRNEPKVSPGLERSRMETSARPSAGGVSSIPDWRQKESQSGKSPKAQDPRRPRPQSTLDSSRSTPPDRDSCGIRLEDQMRSIRLDKSPAIRTEKTQETGKSAPPYRSHESGRPRHVAPARSAQNVARPEGRMDTSRSTRPEKPPGTFPDRSDPHANPPRKNMHYSKMP